MAEGVSGQKFSVIVFRIFWESARKHRYGGLSGTDSRGAHIPCERFYSKFLFVSSSKRFSVKKVEYSGVCDSLGREMISPDMHYIDCKPHWSLSRRRHGTHPTRVVRLRIQLCTWKIYGKEQSGQTNGQLQAFQRRSLSHKVFLSKLKEWVELRINWLNLQNSFEGSNHQMLI